MSSAGRDDRGAKEMRHLFGGDIEIVWVAVKALLLYVTAVMAFRIGRRRTLAEMSPFDFVAAVAAGAIVGRVPNASDASYLEGAVTLVAILTMHAFVTWLRFFPGLAPIFDHRPRLLVAHGRILDRELRRCGLTYNDLFGLLRQHGITDLDQVAFVIFEQRGEISIVRNDAPAASEGHLVREIVARVKVDSGKGSKEDTAG